MKGETELRDNIRWGVTNGLKIATGLSVFVVLEYLVLGDRPFVRIGLSLWSTVMLYVLMALVGGLTVGALRARTNSLAGVACVGAIAGLLAGIAIMLACFGLPGHWTAGEAFSGVVGAPLFGSYVGIRLASD
jgi:hypothetical protein